MLGGAKETGKGPFPLPAIVGLFVSLPSEKMSSAGICVGHSSTVRLESNQMPPCTVCRSEVGRETPGLAVFRRARVPPIRHCKTIAVPQAIVAKSHASCRSWKLQSRYSWLLLQRREGLKSDSCYNRSLPLSKLKSRDFALKTREFSRCRAFCNGHFSRVENTRRGRKKSLETASTFRYEKWNFGFAAQLGRSVKPRSASEVSRGDGRRHMTVLHSSVNRQVNGCCKSFCRSQLIAFRQAGILSSSIG